MLINREYHPEVVAPRDPLNYVLRFAYIVDKLPEPYQAAGGWLIATDGCIAMFAPVELAAGDKLGVVRADLCQLARRAGGKGDLRIRLGSRHIKTADGIIYPRRMDLNNDPKTKYPDLGVLLSKLSTAVVPAGWANFKVGQLTRLLKGLGAETATLEFHGDGPCRVKVVNNTHGFGLIMPVRG